MFTSAAEKGQSGGFVSWFGATANLEDEEQVVQASHGSRHKPLGNDLSQRPANYASTYSPNGIARKKKMLSRYEIGGHLPPSRAPGPGKLYRTTSHRNETLVKLDSQRSLQRSFHGEMAFDTQSAQSSITNSWAPKLRDFYPPPQKAHKPIENMVITVKSKKGDEEKDNDSVEIGKTDDQINSTALSSSSYSAFPGESFRRKKLLGDVKESQWLSEDDVETTTLPRVRELQEARSDMHSLVLTEEQKAEAEQFLFRGWGSDDDDSRTHSHNGATKHPSRGLRKELPRKKSQRWLFKRRKESSLRTISSDDRTPHDPSSSADSRPQNQPLSTMPQTIEDAMRELQQLTGIEVKCLDDTNASGGEPKKDVSHAHEVNGEKNLESSRARDHAWNEDQSKRESNSVASGSRDRVSGGDSREGRGKGELIPISSWFFPNSVTKAQENPGKEKKDDLGQPYALIRCEEDKARLNQYYEEEEHRRLETERKAEQEEEERKTKKAASWFFFSNKEEKEDESVLDDEKVANALDDLEFQEGIAGERRLSQVKEARILAKKGANQGTETGVKTTTQAEVKGLSHGRRLQGMSLYNSSVDMTSPKHFSPEMDRRKQMTEKQKKSLSRFELPLTNSETVSFVGPRADVANDQRRHDQVKGQPAPPAGVVLESSVWTKEEETTHYLKVFQDPAVPLSSNVKKQALIEDNEKRDTRWRLNQLRMDSLFKPHIDVIGRLDGDFQFDEVFGVLEASSDSIQDRFREARNRMLEDGMLSEREVAAFFEGFAIMGIKVQSLQTQLQAFAAVQRSEIAEQDENKASETPRMMMIKSMMADPETTPEVKRLLMQLQFNEEKRISLETHLVGKGVSFPVKIPFEEARRKIDHLSRKLDAVKLGHQIRCVEDSPSEDFDAITREEKKLEAVLLMNKAWTDEDQRWENDNAPVNLDALKRIRRHMPLNVCSLDVHQLLCQITPSGKFLPEKIAARFKKCSILQLLRVQPDEIFRMNPSTLENLYAMADLTISERRALHSHLRCVESRWRAASDDPLMARKWMWFRMVKQQFKENLDQYKRHCDDYGSPQNHQRASPDCQEIGCPLIGKQCPVEADRAFEYTIDYGFPEGPVFAKAARTSFDRPKILRSTLEEGKAKQRTNSLKGHYEGRNLHISLANESCEAMDHAMDRMEILQRQWIEGRLRGECEDTVILTEVASFASAVDELKLSLPQFAERAGMMLTGRKDTNATMPDDRSVAELGLCEELWEHVDDFFTGMEVRLKEIGRYGDALNGEIQHLRDLMDELHDRNMATLNSLGVRYPPPSRQPTRRKDLQKQIQQKILYESQDPKSDGRDISSEVRAYEGVDAKVSDQRITNQILAMKEEDKAVETATDGARLSPQREGLIVLHPEVPEMEEGSTEISGGREGKDDGSAFLGLSFVSEALESNVTNETPGDQNRMVSLMTQSLGVNTYDGSASFLGVAGAKAASRENKRNQAATPSSDSLRSESASSSGKKSKGSSGDPRLQTSPRVSRQSIGDPTSPRNSKLSKTLAALEALRAKSARPAWEKSPIPGSQYANSVGMDDSKSSSYSVRSGKSPARSPHRSSDAAERLAAIEARREKRRLSIAARKKTMEAMAESVEIKSRDGLK